MSDEQWAKVRSVFVSVLSLPPQQRPYWLHQHPDLSNEIAQEVQKLLAHVGTGEGTLDGPAWNEPAGARTPVPRMFEPGEKFAGRFTITKFLGSGGMGEVYGCLDNELGDRIALKILRPELSGDSQCEWRLQRELTLTR